MARPWQPGWLAALCAMTVLSVPASAVTFEIEADHDVVGEVLRDRARDEDTLMDMARIHNVGFKEIRMANPDVDVWLPGEGTEVVIPGRFVLPPGPREGIVVNLAEKRLYYFPPGTDQVITHPIGIGRLDRQTPTATTRVTHKLDHPAWYPTPEVRADYAARGEILPAIVPPGPDNPLGEHAIILELEGYLIHGTHRPDGIGMRVSQGCIRLYPEDIRSLIRQVAIGTPVRIIEQPFKAGIADGRIHVEVHPPLSGETESRQADLGELVRSVDRVMQRRGYQVRGTVDWAAVDAAFGRADGIPVDVTRPRQ